MDEPWSLPSPGPMTPGPPPVSSVPELLSTPPSPLALPSPLVPAIADEDVPLNTIREPSPELDPELLEALGETSDDIPVYGPNIHNKLAQRWLPILKKGLQAETKEKLLKEHAVPENCKLLKAPTLNPEIAAALADFSKGRDKKLQAKQDQLGLGITAINRAMTLLLTGDDKVQALKILSDGCRILTDLHFVETQARTKLITPGLDKSILTTLQGHDRDETLFGNSLPEKIKASKAIEKQGQQIKKAGPPKATSSSGPTTSAARPRGNWTGPPRYHHQSGRGGRTTPYRNQYRRGPAPAHVPAPPAPPPQQRQPASTAPSNKRVTSHH